MSFSRVFQGIFNGVLKKFKGQEKLMDISRNLQIRLKGLLRVF